MKTLAQRSRCIVFEFCEQRIPSSPTERAYLGQVKLVCRWYEQTYGAPLFAQDISQVLCQRYQAWGKYRLSGTTLRARLSALRWVCDCLISSGVIDGHPLTLPPKHIYRHKRRNSSS